MGTFYRIWNEIGRGTCVKRLKQVAQDVLYPRRCPVCDEPVRLQDGMICKDCIGVFCRVKPPRCSKCGKHVESSLNHMFCHDCARAPRYYERGVALFEYASVHDSIHMFKNRGRCEYADYYADIMVKELGEKIRNMEADAIIPIPIHASKMKKRGYNQAALLARRLGEHCKIPVREDILLRVRKTTVQKHLSHIERQNNMKKAFHITQNDVKLNNIILVDDVYTTGNTIDAAAEVLRRHGAKKVFFVTLAIGNGR